jgi:hypothetical protein
MSTEKKAEKKFPALYIGQRNLDDSYSKIAHCFQVNEDTVYFSKVKHLVVGHWYYVFDGGKEDGKQHYKCNARPEWVQDKDVPFEPTPEQLADWEALDLVTRKENERTRYSERMRTHPPHLKDLDDLPRVCASLKAWQRERFVDWLVGELARRWKEKNGK